MRILLRMAASVLWLSPAVAFAASLHGIVTNKTKNLPAQGDKVVLVDVSAGMAEAASATTDANGQFTLQAPGNGSYLIRVDHQGGSYFIAAPQGGAQANVTVYDVAPKVDGVGIDADMLLIEASGGNLRIRERYLVRNISSPPRTQFSENSFEIALPDGAELDEAAATRPGGLGTRTHLVPLAAKGHYSFNVPIQPDQGEKETLFEVAYHFAYIGERTLNVRPLMPADNFVVYTAKGITFSPKNGLPFQATQEDPRVESHLLRKVHPGDAISFAVSGRGEMPTDTGGTSMQPASSVSAGNPGGSTSAPTDSTDSLSSSKTWLLVGLAILLTGTAFALLRKKSRGWSTIGGAVDLSTQARANIQHAPVAQPGESLALPVEDGGALLSSLKEELFTLEQDKIAGRISGAEYTQMKVGLEAVLRRALKGTSH